MTYGNCYYNTVEISIQLTQNVPYVLLRKMHIMSIYSALLTMNMHAISLSYNIPAYLDFRYKTNCLFTTADQIFCRACIFLSLTCIF